MGTKRRGTLPASQCAGTIQEAYMRLVARLYRPRWRLLLMIVPATVCGRRSKAERSRRRSEAAALASSAAHRSLPNTEPSASATPPRGSSASRPSRPDGCPQPAGTSYRDTRKAILPRSSGSWDIPSGERCPRRPATAWATCMAEARRWPTTSTGILDWWRILAAMTTAS